MKTISTFANRNGLHVLDSIGEKYYKLKLKFILRALRNTVSCNLCVDGSEVFTSTHWDLRKKTRKSIYWNVRGGRWLRIRSAMWHGKNPAFVIHPAIHAPLRAPLTAEQQ